jgi:hypothetical protein
MPTCVWQRYDPQNIAFREIWDQIQKENRTLSISPIKRKQEQ